MEIKRKITAIPRHSPTLPQKHSPSPLVASKGETPPRGGESRGGVGKYADKTTKYFEVDGILLSVGSEGNLLQFTVKGAMHTFNIQKDNARKMAQGLYDLIIPPHSITND